MMEVMDVSGGAGVSTDPNNLLNEETCSLDLTDQFYLEDLCASTSASTFYSTLTPRMNLEKLRLSLSFECPEADESAEDFYKRGVLRLKELAPNLQKLNFEGGYVYRSPEENTQAVADELQRLRCHLDMLSSIFIANKLPVLRLHFSAIFTFEERTIRSSNVPDLLKETFDFCDHIVDERLLQRGLIDFIYITNGLPFTIRLLTNVFILRDFVPLERNRFCDGTSEGILRFFHKR
ncbi:hypothetical protein M3Y97_00654000 [Aphelenchoides bicaudatus]|nr:hypothetical protein M3Y97_00654000 [Aphelenchoides bicaudatus]